MLKRDEEHFRARFYDHLKEIHQKEKCEACKKTCIPIYEEDEEPPPTAEEKREKQRLKKNLEAFRKCKCAIFKGNWQQLLYRASEVLKETEGFEVPCKLEFASDDEESEYDPCNANCFAEEEATLRRKAELTEVLAEAKRPDCREDEEEETECEKKEKEKKKKKKTKPVKSCAKVKRQKSQEKPPDPCFTQNANTSKANLLRESASKAAKGSKASVSKIMTSKQSFAMAGTPGQSFIKESDSKASEDKPKKKCIKRGGGKRESIAETRASLAAKGKEKRISCKEEERRKKEQERKALEADENRKKNVWKEDEKICDTQGPQPDEMSTSSKSTSGSSSSSSGSKCEFKSPCPVTCPRMDPVVAMASQKTCQWPAKCRKLYTLQKGDMNVWTDEWFQKQYKEKKRNLKECGPSYTLSNLIPDFCCFDPPYPQQTYEMRHMCSCKPPIKRRCTKKIDENLVCMRPKLWLDMVCVNRCCLGKIVIEFYAETCPYLTKKFILFASEPDQCCRFHLTRVKRDIWIEGHLDSFCCDDEFPLMPCCAENDKFGKCGEEILSLKDGPGILSVSKRFYCGADCGKAIKFTISLGPLDLLKGQRIAIGKVCEGLEVLEKLKKLSTLYGCFKYDVAVQKCGVDYPLPAKKGKKKKAESKDECLPQEKCRGSRHF